MGEIYTTVRNSKNKASCTLELVKNEDKAMATIAVLMSTYNGEEYLREQLDSVLSQISVQTIVVVRDDGSHDETLAILHQYATIHKNIIVLKGENCGAELSFHKLCLYAKDNIKADYYAFCDQDDVWQPEKLKEAYEYLRSYENSKPNLYFSNLRMVDENLNTLRYLFADGEVVISKRMALLQIFTYGCTCVFNRCALEYYCKANLSKDIQHDNWIYVLSMFLGNVFYDTNSYILYRQHGSNLSGEKVTGVKLAIRRVRRATKGNWGHDFELYSSTLLKCFSEQLLPDDLIYIKKVANYRRSFTNKLRLFFSKDYRTGHWNKDILIKTRIIFNQL